MTLPYAIGPEFSCLDKPITAFRGPYRWLSNFWLVPVELDGDTYPSTEHAFQAAKTLDPEWRKIIREASSPGVAKRFGRQIELRPDWEEIRYDVMYYLTKMKFKNPTLKANLLATGHCHLEEGNTWGDTTWGTVNGVGNNWLGQILMKVRAECASES